ncbi:MAG TPA: hypothetical protein VF331_22705 [Polyangiales bacterium]
MRRFSVIGPLIGTLCVTTVLAACASGPRYFEPTEHVRGRTVQGFKEAVYELADPGGKFGEVKIWSYGAHHDKRRGTRIRIVFEFHNTSGIDLGIDAAQLRLDALRSEVPFTDLAPSEMHDVIVEPGHFQALGYTFVLPANVAPSDLQAFRVRWTVYHGAWNYSQQTPFVQEFRYAASPVYYGPAYGYSSDCWPYGPFDCFYGPAGAPLRFEPPPRRGPREAVMPRR